MKRINRDFKDKLKFAQDFCSEMAVTSIRNRDVLDQLSKKSALSNSDKGDLWVIMNFLKYHGNENIRGLADSVLEVTHPKQKRVL